MGCAWGDICICPRWVCSSRALQPVRSLDPAVGDELCAGVTPDPSCPGPWLGLALEVPGEPGPVRVVLAWLAGARRKLFPRRAEPGAGLAGPFLQSGAPPGPSYRLPAPFPAPPSLKTGRGELGGERTLPSAASLSIKAGNDSPFASSRRVVITPRAQRIR